MNQNYKKSSRAMKPRQAGPIKQAWKSKPAKSQSVEKSFKSTSANPKALPHRYKTQMCKAYEQG